MIIIAFSILFDTFQGKKKFSPVLFLEMLFGNINKE